MCAHTKHGSSRGLHTEKGAVQLDGAGLALARSSAPCMFVVCHRQVTVTVSPCPCAGHGEAAAIGYPDMGLPALARLYAPCNITC